MAYQLEYDFQKMKKSDIKKKKMNYFVAGVLLALTVIFVRFGGVALEVLFYGEQENFLAASTKLVDQLREGNTMREAVNAFCYEIINE